MSAIQQTATRTVRISQFDTTQPVAPMDLSPLATASGACPPEQFHIKETEHFGPNTVPEDHHRLLDEVKEKLVEVKDKITGNTPEKKAVKYSKKCVKELKKENKYAEEAEEYAEKGAKKAEKYAHKAEKYLEKKEKACEKAAVYREKANENAEKMRECRDAHLQKDADLLHDAACRLQSAR
uniref:Uncharacterized protein n=1 Tax=Acrobeloides nanus TaxID=290746 RepID=A0A914E3V6_9BILA